jgi:hypothetical protein
VVLVDALGLVDAAIQARRVVLREADDGLQVHEHVEGQAQDGVRRGKVLMAGPCLVQLDDDEAGGEGGRAGRVEEGVGEGARALLRGRVGRLQDQGRLDREQEAR